ncbi:MAG: hypothetical protein JSW73_02295 [Candidatus Woesearchaeota archaeon]|nr:MAG: hypothetical protein JSW73_02295 [Candidatus Woesearchaeota archaeon]
MVNFVKRTILTNVHTDIKEPDAELELSDIIIKEGVTFGEIKKAIGAESIELLYTLSLCPKEVDYSQDAYEKLEHDHVSLEAFFPKSLSPPEFRERITKYNKSTGIDDTNN